MTILALMMTVMLLGFGALVADIGRLYNLHSQMQSYVDQVALAAAAELDGEADAITRATRAALGDGTNRLWSATSRTSPSVPPSWRSRRRSSTARFPPTMPPTTKPCSLGSPPPDPAEGAVRPHSRDPAAGELLPDAAGRADRLALRRRRGDHRDRAGPGDRGFQARGVQHPAADDLQPLRGTTDLAAPTSRPCYRPTDPAQEQGPGSAWAPGNFGLLQTVEGAGEPTCNGGGANRIRCVLGLVHPEHALHRRTAELTPARAENWPVHAGINVRFDIWDAPCKERTTRLSVPLGNVTKGSPQNDNQCRGTSMNTPRRLQRCPSLVIAVFHYNSFSGPGCRCRNWLRGARFGSGDTGTANSYCTRNHPGAVPRAGPHMTRYQTYQWENRTGVGYRTGRPGEDGNPTCAARPAPRSDRRATRPHRRHHQLRPATTKPNGTRDVRYINSLDVPDRAGRQQL